MSNLRRQAAKSLADVIHKFVPSLQESPSVIAAPPSEAADYPRVAILLERFKTEWAEEEELMVDEDGELLMGARARLLPPAGAAMLGTDSHLSKIGSLRSDGRIWVGCRLHPKREEIEDAITTAFCQDTMASGRILLPIKNPRVGQFTLDWDWTAACFIEETEWTREFAFSERLWAWMKFNFDVDILIPRADPIMSQIVFGINVDTTNPNRVQVPDKDPDVVDVDPFTEHFLINIDGSVSAYP